MYPPGLDPYALLLEPIIAPGLVPAGGPAAVPAEAGGVLPAAAASQPRGPPGRRIGMGFAPAMAATGTRAAGTVDPALSLDPDVMSEWTTTAAAAAGGEDFAAANAELSPEGGP